MTSNRTWIAFINHTLKIREEIEKNLLNLYFEEKPKEAGWKKRNLPGRPPSLQQKVVLSSLCADWIVFLHTVIYDVIMSSP